MNTETNPSHSFSEGSDAHKSSPIAKKIMDSTPEELKDKVKDYGKNVVEKKVFLTEGGILKLVHEIETLWESEVLLVNDKVEEAIHYLTDRANARIAELEDENKTLKEKLDGYRGSAAFDGDL